MNSSKRLMTATLTGVAFALVLVTQTPTALARETPNLEISFTKWITSYPHMAGVVSGDVVGDFAGLILKREVIAGGKIVQLEALYGILAGDHSFVAHVQGAETIQTLHAVLNGEIVEGWLAGAQVHVEFEVVPCEAHRVCFKGTIRIMPASAD